MNVFARLVCVVLGSAWLSPGCGDKTPGGETAGEDSSSSGEPGSTTSDSGTPTSSATASGEASSTSQGQDSAAEPSAGDDTGPGAPDEEIPTDPGPYLRGIDGVLVVEESRSFAGNTLYDAGAGAWAQFFNAPGAQGHMLGQVLDPFEGVEDCGVFFFDGDGSGAGDDITFLSADTVRVEVGGSLQTMDHGSDLFYHWLTLVPPDDDPAPGSRFSFEVRGGEVGDSDVPGPTVPPKLAFTAPNFDAPLGRSDLTLQWTGTGAAPLALKLIVTPKPEASRESTEIRCSMIDDGSFTIPAAVLALVPDDGFTAIYVARNLDEEQTDNGRTYLARGASTLAIYAGFGETCESPPDNLTACEAAAVQINAAREACGLQPEPLASRCPAFLAELCVDCVDYYACFAAGWSCQPDGLHTGNNDCECE